VSDDVVAGLLDDMQEYYEAFDFFPLYQLGWALRRGQPMTDHMRDLARQAYDTFTATRRTQVVWTRWPIDLDTAWPVAPGTPLEFDLDPDGDVDEPLQVLVPG
jgi:hypothetical protein